MSAPPPLSSLLEYQQRLIIECCRCRHKVEMTPEDAIETFGPDMTFPRLKRILKCSECNARGRDREISAYPNHSDYYAWLERRRYADEVAKLGKDAADLARHYRLRNSSEEQRSAAGVTKPQRPPP